MTGGTLEELIVLIVIVVACGAAGKAIAGGDRHGLIFSGTLGALGALIVPWMAHEMHLSEPAALHVIGHLFPMVWSMIGAVVFVAARQGLRQGLSRGLTRRIS